MHNTLPYREWLIIRSFLIFYNDSRNWWKVLTQVANEYYDQCILSTPSTLFPTSSTQSCPSDLFLSSFNPHCIISLFSFSSGQEKVESWDYSLIIRKNNFGPWDWMTDCDIALLKCKVLRIAKVNTQFFFGPWRHRDWESYYVFDCFQLQLFWTPYLFPGSDAQQAPACGKVALLFATCCKTWITILIFL